MGKIKKLVALGLVAVASMSFVGCKMIAKTPEAIKNEALAKVGDQKITRGDLEKVMTPLYAQYEQQYGKDYKDNPQVKSALLEQEKSQLNALVDQKVILMKAKEEKWEPSEETINKDVDEQIKAFKSAYPTEEAFKQFYEAYGYTSEDDLKDFLKKQIIVSDVINEHIYKDIKVTDADVKKYYDENKKSFTVQAGANVSHILVADKGTAEKVEKELKDGKSFKDLAKEYGTDGTKENGGSLGYIPYNTTEYDKDFMNAVKKLKKNGEVSEPVKTQFGYHIIKVENIKSKDEVLPLKDVKEDIENNLLKADKKKAYEDTLKKWKEEIKIKVYEDRLK